MLKVQNQNRDKTLKNNYQQIEGYYQIPSSQSNNQYHNNQQQLQKTPIKTLDEQKILRQQLNQLYKNLQGSYGDYRNKLVKVLNYKDDQQIQSNNSSHNHNHNINENQRFLNEEREQHDDYNSQNIIKRYKNQYQNQAGRNMYKNQNQNQHQNQKIQKNNHINRRDNISESPADKYVQSVSKKIIQQRKAYRLKQKQIQNQYLGIQMGMEQYKNQRRSIQKEIDNQRAMRIQNNRQQLQQQQQNKKPIYSHHQQKSSGLTFNSNANLNQYPFLNQNDGTRISFDPSNHPIYIQQQSQSLQQAGYQNQNRNFDTFRRQEGSSGRSAFQKYKQRETKNPNYLSQSSQDQYYIDPITIAYKNPNQNYNNSKFKKKQLRNRQDYQGQYLQQQDYLNVQLPSSYQNNNFKQKQQGETIKNYYHPQQQNSNPMMTHDYASSQQNYHTVTDHGDFGTGSQVGVFGQRGGNYIVMNNPKGMHKNKNFQPNNKGKHQEYYQDGNMSEKLHINVNFPQNSPYRNKKSPHNLVTTFKNKSKNALYDQIRSMRLGGSHVQELKKQKQYNNFLLNQQKVLQDQKNKSRILMDQAFNMIGQKKSEMPGPSSEYMDSFGNSQIKNKNYSPPNQRDSSLKAEKGNTVKNQNNMANHHHHHHQSTQSAVSPIKRLKTQQLHQNFQINNNSPSSKSFYQQIHHRYDQQIFKSSSNLSNVNNFRDQKLQTFSQNFNRQPFQQENYNLQQYQQQQYQEPIHDYEHNFDSYLHYFLNQVIDLFTIAELIKYNLKYKSYEMLTKLFAFAHPQNLNNKRQRSKQKIIGIRQGQRYTTTFFTATTTTVQVKDIDLSKKIKLSEFHLLVSRMLKQFKKSQVDHICRNIFSDKNELTFDEFRESLSSGLSDHQAQQLSSAILNLQNTRTIDLMKRLFLTWTQLRYFQKRIKDLLKSQPSKMQQFIEQITLDNLISGQMLLQYLRQGDQGIKIRNRKLRVDIYLNRVMGEMKKQVSFLKWVYMNE